MTPGLSRIFSAPGGLSPLPWTDRALFPGVLALWVSRPGAGILAPGVSEKGLGQLQAIMITVTYCNILVNFWPIVYHLCELLAQSIEYRFQGDFPMIERRFEKFTVNGPKVH